MGEVEKYLVVQGKESRRQVTEVVVEDKQLADSGGRRNPTGGKLSRTYGFTMYSNVWRGGSSIYDEAVFDLFHATTSSNLTRFPPKMSSAEP